MIAVASNAIVGFSNILPTNFVVHFVVVYKKNRRSIAAFFLILIFITLKSEVQLFKSSSEAISILYAQVSQ